MSLLDSEIEVIDKISIKDLIIEWLKKYKIKNYKINNDLTIDVDDSVDLYEYSESQLPNHIQFNEVNGYFNISYSQIKTLKGCPIVVNGCFDCSCCPNLKSLEGAPEIVKEDFYCAWCKNLESLKGSPKKVGCNFDCHRCQNLKSLEGAPEKIGSIFYCDNCKNLKSFEGVPKIIMGNFDCSRCKNFKYTTK